MLLRNEPSKSGLARVLLEGGGSDWQVGSRRLQEATACVTCLILSFPVSGSGIRECGVLPWLLKIPSGLAFCD